MALLVLSFIAGVLTVAAPCILPLLPVVIGGALADEDTKNSRSQWLRPLVIAASLAVSVTVFTLLLKATTVLLGVPQFTWQLVSGTIVLLLGMHFIFPALWERVSATTGFFTKANHLLGSAGQKKGYAGAALIGAALGPVFNSCSPTYALIVATVLPVSFLQGTAYLLAYAIGLGATLLLVAYAGQAFVSKLRLFANPHGLFRRSIGVLFVIVAVAVLLGLDKEIQAFVLERGWYDPISDLEKHFTR
jgi:cytochrome c-type biogenesis protein